MRKNQIPFLYIYCYIFVVSLFCLGSSPLLDYMSPDAQIFWTIGRSMEAGQIVYKDIFDHKGIYLFFINYLGALICNNSEMGLFFIETIFQCINLVCVYWITKLILKDDKKAFLTASTFMAVSMNYWTFCTGNAVQEYALSMQLISCVLIIKYYLEKSDIEHPPIYMYVHGICAGIVVFIQANIVGMWIPFGIILACRLFVNKKIANFVKNLIMLLLGVITAILPVLIYGVKYNCIEDIIFGTFGANFIYTANNSASRDFASFLIGFVKQPAFLIVIFAVISCFIVYRRIKLKWFICSFISLFLCSMVFMNVSLRSNGNYYHAYMVFIIPFLIYIINWISSKIPMVICILGIIVATICGNLQLPKQVFELGTYPLIYQSAVDMKEVLDSDTEDYKVLATGCNAVFYNTTNTIPHIKYFVTFGGGLHYEVFPDAVEMQYDSLISGVNKYILINFASLDEIWGVQDMDEMAKEYLVTNYDVVYELKEQGVHTAMYKLKK